MHPLGETGRALHRCNPVRNHSVADASMMFSAPEAVKARFRDGPGVVGLVSGFCLSPWAESPSPRTLFSAESHLVDCFVVKETGSKNWGPLQRTPQDHAAVGRAEMERRWQRRSKWKVKSCRPVHFNVTRLKNSKSE